ncbi:hypothetical protein FO519_004991, partial [Halicephalobus sp. NKZ332]
MITLTCYVTVLISILFSPDGKRVSFIGSYNQVYDVSVDEPFSRPRKLSSGIGCSINLGYSSDGDMIQAVNLFGYHNLTEALQSKERMERIKYEAVKVNKYGNFKKRFSNFTGFHDRFIGGFREGLVLGTEYDSLFVTDLDSGREQKVFYNQEKFVFLGSVFHKKENLVFFGIGKDSTSFIYSSKFDGSERKLIYKGNVGLYIYDICNEGKHLLVSEWYKLKDEDPDMATLLNKLRNYDPNVTTVSASSKYRDPEMATISIKSGKLEPITLANNTIRGYGLKLSQDGSLLTFVSEVSRIHQVFVVEWEKKRENGTKKKLEELKKDEITKKKELFKSNLRERDENGEDKGNKKGWKVLQEEERHLKNVRQLTFGGQNAEGYFAFKRNSIVFQAAGLDAYGTSCDQIYNLNFDVYPKKEDFLPRRLSTGLGSCTCSYFFPDDEEAIFASTFLSANLTKINDDKLGTCEEKKCQSNEAEIDPVLKQLCNTSYTWDLHHSYDIFKVDEFGNFLERITNAPGYDAEGAISPDGRLMVFTSVRSGDPELWIYDFRSKNFRQLTNELGYDGGPFFS